MGGAASTPITAQQTIAVTKALKAKYEFLCGKGINDEEIQKLLTEEYMSVITANEIPEPSADTCQEVKSTNTITANKSIKNEPIIVVKETEKRKPPTQGRVSPAPATNGGSGNDTSIDKGSGGTRSNRGSFENETSSNKNNLPKGSGKIGLGHGSSQKAGAGGSSKVAGAARRRSFDGRNSNLHKIATTNADSKTFKANNQSSGTGSGKTSPVPATNASRSATPTDPDGAAEMDSWDSVSAQPYCKICQMAFKSISFLDRHVKYSDVHARNVKKAEEPAPTMTTGLPITASGKLAPAQIEGQHYKLMYSGSKLFWRTQEQVDLNFFHHVLPHTIEVIAYDTIKGKEVNRIYLDYYRLSEFVAEYNKALGTHHEDSNGNEEHSMLSRFILQRLQLQPAATLPTPPSPKESNCSSVLQFIKLSSDSYEVSPLLATPPVVLVPVTVTRRRRTNAEEINATMQGLASDRAALVEATGNAQQIANLVYTSATSIAEKKWWADFNPARRKWVWAIRRVIRQKLVAETKVILKMREAAKSKAQRRLSMHPPILKTNSKEI